MTALGIVAGFGREIAAQIQAHASAPPLVVLVHGAAFTAWLALLTAQVLLIRSRRVGIHRKLGVAGMVLAAAMVILGTWAAVTMARLELQGSGKPDVLLSLQFIDMLAFAALVAAAFLARKQPAAHKRLILLATFAICDAGFARLLGLGGPLPWLGELLHRGGGGPWAGFWADLAALRLGPFVLILGLGVYDWITRRKLHPAYVAGATGLVLLQLASVALMVDPLWRGWRPVALALIGH